MPFSKTRDSSGGGTDLEGGEGGKKMPTPGWLLWLWRESSGARTAQGLLPCYTLPGARRQRWLGYGLGSPEDSASRAQVCSGPMSVGQASQRSWR